MNSYQKLATFILRIGAAACTTIIALGWSLYAIEAALGVNVQHYPAHTVIGNMAYIVFGALVLLFSAPLGRLLGRGLGE